jgi:hypothetical protein
MVIAPPESCCSNPPVFVWQRPATPHVGKIWDLKTQPLMIGFHIQGVLVLLNLENIQFFCCSIPVLVA